MSDRLPITDQEGRIRRELDVFIRLADWDYSSCSTSTQTLLRLIHTHLFLEALNVEWLEERAGSLGTEAREQFKRGTKFRIHDYIENRRALAAMWLLWDNDLDISTLSYSVGYTNYRTFARAFERQVGCAPVDFRRRWSRDRGPLGIARPAGTAGPAGEPLDF